MEQKNIIYARNNISEYWVIDLKNNQLIVHIEPKDNKYTRVIEYKTGAISPLVFPEIFIDLKELLLY